MAESTKIEVFPLFTWLWAWQIAIHLGQWSLWAASPAEYLLLLAACACVLNPRSLLRLAIMAAIQIGIALKELPWVSNHDLVMTFVNLTLLASIASVWIRDRSVSVDGERVFEAFAPLCRTTVLILYCFVVFHKLNTDFFNPEVSCAVHLYKAFLPSVPSAAGQWFEWGAIISGIGIEALLIVLLSVRRFRPAGILIGGLFHLVLGLMGFFRFSAMMYVLYVAFLPPDSVNRVAEWWRSAPYRVVLERVAEASSSWCSARGAFKLVLVLVTVIVVLFSPWRGTDEMFQLVRIPGAGGDWPLLNRIVQGGWLVWSLALLVLYWRVVMTPTATTDAREDCGSRNSVPHWLWVLPVLVAFNGLCPYLGLKTESSYAMFSNLRLQGDRSNHLLVHAPLDLAPEWSELILVTASSDAELAEVAGEHYLLARLELASYIEHRLRGDEDFSLGYEFRGQNFHVESVRDDSHHFPAPPLLIRKLLYFQPVYAGASSMCTH